MMKRKFLKDQITHQHNLVFLRNVAIYEIEEGTPDNGSDIGVGTSTNDDDEGGIASNQHHPIKKGRPKRWKPL